MAAEDIYYEDLVKEAAGVAPFAAGATKRGGLRGLLSSKGAKIGIGSLIGWMALDKILNEINQAKGRGLQKQAIRSQAAAASPENLYYEAALPSAQAEEEQARQMLFSQILGGVTGPSLARGEKLIG
jgi:hypothetical protein